MKKFPNRTRVLVVKSVCDGNIIRQKVLRHVGTGASEEQLRQLKQFGQLIIEEIRQAESRPGLQGHGSSNSKLIDKIVEQSHQIASKLCREIFTWC